MLIRKLEYGRSQKWPHIRASEAQACDTDDAKIRAPDTGEEEDRGVGWSVLPLCLFLLSKLALFSDKLCIAAIAKSLNIEPDEQAESPGTAKRRFEQESDDEVVEEEEEGEEEEGEEGEEEGEMSESSNSGVGGGVQGEYMYVDERVAARDSLIVGTVGGDLMMSGALQDP